MIGCFLLNTVVARPRRRASPRSADAAAPPVPRAQARSPVDDRLPGLLDSLTTPERQVLLLRVRLAYSTDETARALGVSPDQVRVTQHRALQHLRDELRSS